MSREHFIEAGRPHQQAHVLGMVDVNLIGTMIHNIERLEFRGANVRSIMVLFGLPSGMESPEHARGR